MVNVGEVLVVVGEHQVTVLLPRHHLDRLHCVTRVADIDRMRMHEHLMRVPMPVTRRAHDQYAGQ